jgi:DNA end-binding protein Ku
LSEIDRIYFDATYYLAPPARTPESGRKAYALLREALARSERVGIGRFVMRTKQYLVAVRPVDRLLYLETLLFADEVRAREHRREQAAPLAPRRRARQRGVNTQNSLPSGSAMTTQLTSPWPMSIRDAPSVTRRSTSVA